MFDTAYLRALYSLCLVAWYGLASAVIPLQPSIQLRNAPGTHDSNTYLAIKRGLAVASLTKREAFKAELPLEKSWDNATLLSIQVAQEIPQNNQSGGMELTCTTCYVRGFATAELTIDDNFNASEALDATKYSVRDTVSNLTETFENYIQDYTRKIIQDIANWFEWSDLEFLPFPFSFNMDVPEIPECHIRFQFDDMELYLELHTFLDFGATYEINLYATQSPIGIKIGPMLQLGVVLSVDLILVVDGAIDISSGFHIKFDDGIAMDITLFGDKISNMIFNGAQFEFLPVTVESDGVVISAVLRIGAHCGIEVTSPETQRFPKPGFTVAAGIEVAVVAHVAEFNTNVT
ncbi:Nn.00g084420.m01.CDS01 [Neocucurbitaria sp. VM-36]